MAMGILATGLLAVSAAQLYAMRGASSGRHGSDAAEIAQQRVELMQRVRWTDTFVDPLITSTAGAWVDAPAPFQTLVTTSTGVVAEQTYTLQTRVTDTVSASGVYLKTIDVRVNWDEPNRPGRTYTISTMRHRDVRS